MSVWAAVAIGYLIGSAPTANALARMRGIDLTSSGSANPGTNNARKLGGYGLAASVLVVEMAKGVLAVVIGGAVAGDVGALMAGVSAVAGNIFSIWYRMKGGKGLAIGAGVLLMAWPMGAAIAVILIALLAVVTRSTGKASIGTLISLFVMSWIWFARAWPNAWGIDDVGLLPYLAGALVLLVSPKHLRDAMSVTQPSHP